VAVSDSVEEGRFARRATNMSEKVVCDEVK
jgi:hypothetical protein